MAAGRIGIDAFEHLHFPIERIADLEAHFDAAEEVALELALQASKKAHEEMETLAVDKDARAVGPVERVIAVARRRLPRERIAEPGTPAGFDPDAKPAFRKAVLGRHLPDEFPRVLTYLEHCSLAWP